MLLGLMTALRRRRVTANDVPATVSLRPDAPLYSAYKGLSEELKLPLANTMLLTLQQVADAVPSDILEMEDYNKLLLAAQRVRAAMHLIGLPVQYVSQATPGLTPADLLSDKDLLRALTPNVVKELSEYMNVEIAWLLGKKSPIAIEESWAQSASRIVKAIQDKKKESVTLFLVRLNTADWEKAPLDSDDWTPNSYLMPLVRYQGNWDFAAGMRLVTYQSWSPERYAYMRNRLDLRKALGELYAAHVNMTGLSVSQEIWDGYRQGSVLPDKLIDSSSRHWPVDAHVPGHTNIPHLKDEEQYLIK